jgi:hypothetical protein
MTALPTFFETVKPTRPFVGLPEARPTRVMKAPCARTPCRSNRVKSFERSTRRERGKPLGFSLTLPRGAFFGCDDDGVTDAVTPSRYRAFIGPTTEIASLGDHLRVARLVLKSA